MRYKLMTFNVSNLEAMPSAMNSEVAAIVHEVELNLESKSIRSDLSEQFRALFEQNGWKQDTNLWFEPGRRDTPHFIKDRILTQVSWRHYGMIGTELLRFQKDYIDDKIEGGFFVCITDQLDMFLKENYVSSGITDPFDGSIKTERVGQYLKNVGEIITVPLLIMGLMLSSDSQGLLT